MHFLVGSDGLLTGLQIHRSASGNILLSDQARIRLNLDGIVHYLDILRHALQCGGLQSIRDLLRLEQFLIIFSDRALLHAVLIILHVVEHGHIAQVVGGERGVVGFCQIDGPLVSIGRVFELL